MDALSKNGWPLSDECVGNYFGDDLAEVLPQLHQTLLDSDIREVISTSAPKIERNENGDIVKVPLILQIQKVRNVAVPKLQENDRDASNRLLTVNLTGGGKTELKALEMGIVKGLDPKTKPGTKIQLTNVVRFERGFLLLTSSNARVLGGQVAKLIEKADLKDPNSLVRQRPTGEGPPPWVPFGQKPKLDGALATVTKNMRVMDLAAVGKQEAPPISEEFNQIRQNEIAQAMKKQDRSMAQSMSRK